MSSEHDYLLFISPFYLVKIKSRAFCVLQNSLLYSKKVKAVGIHKIQILERTERPCRSASDRGILLFLAKLSEERKPSLKSNEVFSREKNDFGV